MPRRPLGLWPLFVLASASASALALAGCAHTPETVVHLSAPAAGSWTVRDPRGAPLCSLPCSVELDEHETVVVHHGAGKQFIVSQDTLGKGVYTGSIRVREEPTAGALAVQAFSGALMNAGATLLAGGAAVSASSFEDRDPILRRRDERVAAAIVLTGFGTAAVLASRAIPGKKHEELWLEKIASR